MCGALTRRLCCALAAALLIAEAGAQVIRPDSAGRVTRRFTFEERRTNPTDLPNNWIRAQHDPPSRVRPGFPIWNRAELDYTVARTGEGSVRLPTRGGSASLLLDPGVVPVFPEADYTVVAAVRTDEVSHAKARLVARLLDSAGGVIPGSEARSAPLATSGAWETVSLKLLGDDAEAASLQIELLLEQPGPVGDIPFEELEVVPEDFAGAAWFDDISVLQVPRVELWADEPGNLFDADETPEVSLFLRDLVGQELDVGLRALDASGSVVASERLVFAGGRLERSWAPDLDGHGWYRIVVTADQEGATVGSASVDLVWRGERRDALVRPSSTDAALETRIEGVPTTGLRELGELTIDAGLLRVSTDLCFDGAPADRDRVSALALLANRLSPRGRELGLAIESLPPEIEGFGGVDGILTALADRESAGAEWIEPLLIELGHRVRRWSFGETGGTVGTHALGVLGDANRRLHDLVPGAILGLTVSPFERLPVAVVGPAVSVARDVVGPVPVEEVGALIGEFIGAAAIAEPGGWGRPEGVAVLHADEASEVGLPAALDRMVLAALQAKLEFDRGGGESAGVVRLDRAWRWRAGRRAQLMPHPTAAAWLTVADQFIGRRAERLARVAPGVSGALLVPSEGRRGPSVAAFWSEPVPGAPSELLIRLAQSDAVEIDRSGNRRVLTPEPIGGADLMAHRVDLSGGVVFVEGVDAELLRFQSSVAAEDDLIETTVAGDGLAIGLTNPWPGSLRGEYFLVEPGGLSAGVPAERDRAWDITPRFGSFSAEPGGDARLEFAVDTSPAVYGGLQPMLLDFRLDAPSFSGSLRVERDIRVGLDDIGLDVVTLFAPGDAGPDLVVYAIVRNTGASSKTVNVYAGAPGYPRERSAPMPVQPGVPAVKVFSFAGGRDALAGREIGVGLFIREDGERLRKRVPIDAGP